MKGNAHKEFIHGGLSWSWSLSCLSWCLTLRGAAVYYWARWRLWRLDGWQERPDRLPRLGAGLRAGEVTPGLTTYPIIRFNLAPSMYYIYSNNAVQLL